MAALIVSAAVSFVLFLVYGYIYGFQWYAEEKEGEAYRAYLATLRPVVAAEHFKEFDERYLKDTKKPR